MLTNLYSDIVANLSRYLSRPGRRNPDPCLTDVEIANLLDDRYSQKKKERLFAHLHHCADCYALWSESAAFVKTGPAAPETKRVSETAGKTLSTPGKWLFPVVWVPAIGAAAILLLTLWTGTGHYPDKIDHAYAQLAKVENLQLERLAMELDAQTQTNTMAFSPATASDPQQAFTAGIHDGAERLKRLKTVPKSPLKSSTWKRAPYDDYYHFGRWVALASFTTRLQPADIDWPQLRDILAEIQTRLSQQAHDSRDKAIALEQIDQLQSALVPAGATRKTGRNALRQALSMTIAKLTP